MTELPYNAPPGYGSSDDTSQNSPGNAAPAPRPPVSRYDALPDVSRYESQQNAPAHAAQHAKNVMQHFDPNDPNAGEDPLLEGLTEPQLQAVQHVDGPLLVLAGAGSGKTRVITRRIAHLILRVGIAPWNVLAITFTNKAAGEMRERLTTLLSERQAKAATVATFHSLCARIIRQYAHLLNLPPNFTIYDSSDQQRVIKQAVEQLDINTNNFPPAKVLHAISSAKNEMVSCDEYEKQAYDFFSKNVAKVYRKYQSILAANKSCDFDDLLLMTVRLMKDHPQALEELRERFQYLLIDEYQDTNHVQFLLAHTLAAKHKNICATGDPDQSIYAWRGANVRNILEFETYYPGAITVKLEQNYRSTQNILAVADALIRHNEHRKHKELWTENPVGDPIRLCVSPDERVEAANVVKWFETLNADHDVPWSDMAVFYRANNLSRVMEDALRTSNIPYQIAKGTSFYERKEIKDALSYLRLVSNHDDAINMLRVINTPTRGISTSSVKAIQLHAIAHHLTVRQVVYDPRDLTMLTKRAISAITQFAQTVETWRTLAGLSEHQPSEQISFRALVERILRESGLEDFYRNDKTDPDGERIDNLGELVSSAQQFEDDFLLLNDGVDAPLSQKLGAYLEQVSLVSDVDSIKSASGAVTLMTLHAAKGLEFPAVAMIGMEDGILPHQRAAEDGRDVEEERRLCFVGITRAQERLMLSRALRRSVFGQTLPTIPSRFLAEMPKDRMEEVKTEYDYQAAPSRFGSSFASGAGRSARGTSGQLVSGNDSPFPPGTNVRHPLFGDGKVLTVSSAGGAGSRAQVHFQKAGIKTLILEYAKLEKI